MKQARIMIVEDESIIAMESKMILQTIGHHVTAIVSSGEDAIETVKNDQPDLILMDIRLKGVLDGIETADIIKTRFGTPVIFQTAYLDEERMGRVKITMPFGCLLKPVHQKELKITIEMGLYIAKVDTERKKAEEELRLRESQLLMILNNTSDYIALFSVESGNNTRLVSPNAAYMRGVKLIEPKTTENDIVGVTIEELCQVLKLPGSLSKQIKGYHLEVMETHKQVNVLETLPSQDGFLYLQDTYSPILDENGNCTYVLFVSHDITELKKKEIELENLLRKK